MKQEENNQKRTFLDILLSIIDGGVLGLFSWLPFSSYQDIKEDLHTKERTISKKEEKLSSYIGKYFLDKWPLLLGILLGAIFFFSIPVQTLTEKYKAGVYGGLLAFIVPFLVQDIFLFIKDRNVTLDHFIISVILFLVGTLVPILTFSFVRVEPETFLSFPTYLLTFVLMLVGGFLMSFSGIGYGTLFFCFHFYLTFGTGVRDLAILQHVGSYLPLVLVSLIGALIGYGLSLLLNYKAKSPLREERHAINIGLRFSGIILLIPLLRPPFLVSGVSEMAQKYTIFTAIVAFFVVSAVLTLPTYLPKKKDNQHALG